MLTYRISYLILLIFLCTPLSWASKVNLPPPEGEYNILMLLVVGSESHRNCFMPLAEALAERGHKVTILSSLPPKGKHPNIKEIRHDVYLLDTDTDANADTDSDINMFDMRDVDPSGGIIFKEFLPHFAREIYKSPAVMDLYNNRAQFDLILIDQLFNEPAYPFLEGTRYIGIETAGILASTSALLGNVLNPAFISSLAADYERPYSFIKRAKNIYDHIYYHKFWTDEVHPLVYKELSVYFPNLPPLRELEKQGLALVFANTHFSLDIPLQELPSQIEVGGMHCRAGEKLPQDLENFINGSGDEGVIYFSLGSVCEGKTIPEKFKKVLVETFSKMKQRIIWKFEENFEGLSSNIMIKKWLPQQDILAHPKVKLFITHGGLLSMQEAAYHATPLLALPVFGDQLRNGQRIINKGFGTYLIWEDLTVELLTSTINELITNPKYKDTMTATSKVFRDQINSPLEKAVWWSEYMIRHNGAPQLKSPAAELSWIEYLCIDIILAVHAILIIIVWILKKFVKYIAAKAFGSSKVKRD